jgi:hypothetical protein
VTDDIVVREAQDAETLLREVDIAPCVMRQTRVRSVLIAIDLDDEARAEAAEVRDVGTDCHLAPEVRATDG